MKAYDFETFTKKAALRDVLDLAITAYEALIVYDRTAEHAAAWVRVVRR